MLKIGWPLNPKAICSMNTVCYASMGSTSNVLPYILYTFPQCGTSLIIQIFRVVYVSRNYILLSAEIWDVKHIFLLQYEVKQQCFFTFFFFKQNFNSYFFWTQHSHNALNSNMQDNNFTMPPKARFTVVKHPACCFECVPHRAGSACGEGEESYIEIKILPGIMSWVILKMWKKKIQSTCELKCAPHVLLIWHASSVNRLPVTKIPGHFPTRFIILWELKALFHLSFSFSPSLLIS